MKHLWILYIYLPAFIANATPILAKNIPCLREWNTPISEKYLGKNKTYRGLLTGIFCAALTSIAQRHFDLISLPYATFSNALVFGFLLGSGALVGDLVESFAKRQLNIAPGKALPVFDGIDYILGAIIFVLPFYTPTITELGILVFASPVLSLLANTVSYFLGWKNVWY